MSRKTGGGRAADPLLRGCGPVTMEAWDSQDEALVSPAVARNRDAILDILRRILPERGLVLEIASGSGEHAVHVARHRPDLVWQPTDPEPTARSSIMAHTDRARLTNVLPPLALDAAAAWPIDRADAVVAINMIHIAPWAATEGLMKGAGRVLPAGGCLYLYGAFTRGGRHDAASNAAFDADLRRRDSAWGLRDIEAVAETGRSHGLDLAEIVAMPANNLSLILRRRSGT